ncbi:MAG: DUF2795 domain-containing protein [Ignavibacteria bacterium]|nr:DUF2795 domain-containing protein [Ignavibacteria bacterium]
MFWTPELASFLEDAPWPATKDELIDYCDRTAAPFQVIDNLMELDDPEDPVYEGIEDLWPEYEEASDDFFFSEDDELSEY